MKKKECVIFCSCKKGAFILTSLRNERGMPVLFLLTEDETIRFEGVCSNCGLDMVWEYSVLQLLFACPKDRPIN